MVTAIVHEWLESSGGAENVVERFAAIFPEATIFALWNDAPERFPSSRVRESWLSRTMLRRHKALALPVMPAVWRNVGALGADVILCSSHLFAHHVRIGSAEGGARKLVYAHTPARYIWEPGIDKRGQSLPVRAVGHALRPLDRSRAQEAHSIAANSRFVAERIERCWGRDARVIYPPVGVRRLQAMPVALDPDEEAVAEGLPDTFLLGASRLVPYKRLDLVIKAGIASNTPVVIAGSGPDLERLKLVAAEASVPVVFIPRPSDRLLAYLYRACLLYVFPAVEDFGIMPVEAMALGAAVVGLNVGGVRETIIDGVSGALVESFDSVRDVREAIEQAAGLEKAPIREWSMRFDDERFDDDVLHWVKSESGAVA